MVYHLSSNKEMSENEEFIPYIDFMTGQIGNLKGEPSQRAYTKIKTFYPIQAVVEYSNTTDYRKCLRTIFNMKKENLDSTMAEYKHIELDEETLDELAYDEKSASQVLDHVFAITEKHPLFQELYDLGAGLMFSQDRNIGLSVMLSYDYFQYFHVCLMDYLVEPDRFMKDTPSYLGLCKKLT
jgi:hypothetical protein